MTVIFQLSEAEECLHCWSMIVCDEHFRPQKSLFTSVPPHFILPHHEDFILFHFICTSLQFHISLFLIFLINSLILILFISVSLYFFST